MHPADVAEHVAASVSELRDRVAARPELGVTRIDLVDGVDLFVHFTKKVWGITANHQQVIDPVTGRPVVMQARVIDLSPPATVERVLSLNLDQYDARPPTAELLDAARRPLAPQEWPREVGRRGIVHDHPVYGRPFFCRRGLREYHDHFQHEDHPWDCYREGLALHTVVLELLDDLRTRWTS